MTTKSLTNDERKAAEAAFRGLPFDSGWSTAARTVYDGILTMTQGRSVIPDPELAELLQKVSSLPVSGEMPASSPLVQREAPKEQGEAMGPLGGMTREEAVLAGLLVDVSASAREVGISLPVSLTKPVWDEGITVGDQIPEDQQPQRVRELMMALRLFLEQAAVTSPLMEFSALLSFPPETTPQLCQLFVLAHKVASTIASPYALTVLLPREVSALKVLPET